MFRFSKLVLPLLLVLTAACGSDLQRASAQDLGSLFHAPAPEADTVTETESAPARIIRSAGAKLPLRVTRSVSAADPLRLMVIGDSLADGFGMFLKQEVAQRGLPVTILNHGKTSTGLARSDFYDWPAKFVSIASAGRPDIVVAHFGANDNQPLRFAGGKSVAYDTDAWDEAYTSRARDIIDVAASNGAVVYWLGPAPDADAHRNALLTKANRLFRELSRETGAHFLPLSAVTAGPGGAFATSVNGKKIRSGDGSHFTGAGYSLVVNEILAAIDRDNPGLFSPSSVEIASLQ